MIFHSALLGRAFLPLEDAGSWTAGYRFPPYDASFCTETQTHVLPNSATWRPRTQHSDFSQGIRDLRSWPSCDKIASGRTDSVQDMLSWFLQKYHYHIIHLWMRLEIIFFHRFWGVEIRGLKHMNNDLKLDWNKKILENHLTQIRCLCVAQLYLLWRLLFLGKLPRFCVKLNHVENQGERIHQFIAAHL